MISRGAGDLKRGIPKARITFGLSVESNRQEYGLEFFFYDGGKSVRFLFSFIFENDRGRVEWRCRKTMEVTIGFVMILQSVRSCVRDKRV